MRLLLCDPGLPGAPTRVVSDRSCRRRSYGLRRYFPRSFIERRGNDLRLVLLAANLYINRSSNRRHRWRHVRQRDIFTERRRRRAAGDDANRFARLVVAAIFVSSDAALHHLESDQRTGWARSCGSLQSPAANKLAFVHLAVAPEPGFPGIDRVADLVPVERHLGFQPQRVTRSEATGQNSELAAGFHYLGPNFLAGSRIRRHINLKAVFACIAGARN